MNTDIFPYPNLREGQLEVMSKVYESCIKKKNIVIEAHNGFGKTISVLCGTLSACKELGTKMIYACKTKRQVSRVVEEIVRIQQRSKVTACYVYSKFDYCLLRESESYEVPKETFNAYCNYKVSNNLCSYFANFFNTSKNTEKLAQEFVSKLAYEVEIVESCRKSNLCPYELVKLIVPLSDVVVTSYNYVINENLRFLIMPNEQLLRDTILVFDEAHNLADVVYSLCIHSINFGEVNKAIEQAKSFGLQKLADKIKHMFTRMLILAASNEKKFPNSEFVEKVAHPNDARWVLELAIELTSPLNLTWLALSSNTTPPTEMYALGELLTNLVSSRNAMVYLSTTELILVNYETFEKISNYLRKFHNLIFLSATTKPIEHTLKQINIAADFHNTAGFVSTKVMTIIDRSVSTEYKTREREYNKITANLVQYCQACSGSLLIFTTSYGQAMKIKEDLQGKVSQRIYCETKGMSATEATELIRNFSLRQDSILLGVQGGRFAEGESYGLEDVTTVIVVGVALPPPTLELNIRYEFMRNLHVTNPYFLVSLVPAVNKAIQAAGRGLRTSRGKLILVLMDRRFAKLVKLLPGWMLQNLLANCSPEQIREIIKNFTNG